MRQLVFSQKDKEQIRSLDLTPDQVKDQLTLFEKGPPHVTLDRPATIGDGIQSFSPRQKKQLAESFGSLHHDKSMIKFVPSSGAATRMFRIPLSFYNHPEKIKRWLGRKNHPDIGGDERFMTEFLKGFQDKKFPFYADLESVLEKKSLDLTGLINQGKIKTILKYLLTPDGLNYANLPKALLRFHRYPGHSRTPFEEHLIETTRYLKSTSGEIKLHFTLSPEFREKFRRHRDSLLKKLQQNNTRYTISFSIQKPHTSTIAVDKNHHPFRNGEGRLVFRPGGHGALIENLNGLDEGIVFITNIDNVAPDHLKDEVVFHKKVLGGYLGLIQEKIFRFLNILSESEPRQVRIEEIRSFCEEELMMPFPEPFQGWEWGKKRDFVFSILNRPIRVCGMVKNLGEPGGGPFWVRDNQNRISLQIVETSQVQNTESQSAILSQSSHFNPVDLVCGIKNYQGEKFNLRHFIDPDTFFVSEKSLEGKYLRALELPGLWNGAMAEWITLFVDVPVGTFNPVKTVNDLLREQHQPRDPGGKRRHTP